MSDKFYAIPQLVEGHKEARDIITWGNRGTDGGEELEYKTLSEMSSEHLLNILHTQGMLSRDIAYNLVTELYYRAEGLVKDE